MTVLRTGAEPRPLWLGTSWKMTKTLAESRAYVEELGRTPVPDDVQAFLLPPLTALCRSCCWPAMLQLE